MSSHFTISIGPYSVACDSCAEPSSYEDICNRAVLVDRINQSSDNATPCFLSVAHPFQWPFLAVLLQYSPGPRSGFFPGALITPQTDILYLGAGDRLVAYDLVTPSRLWETTVEVGFWGLAQHNDVVVMSAETECAAWNLRGEKLWTTFVEPPWDYAVDGETIMLSVMGKRQAFSIKNGPQ